MREPRGRWAGTTPGQRQAQTAKARAAALARLDAMTPEEREAEKARRVARLTRAEPQAGQ